MHNDLPCGSPDEIHPANPFHLVFSLGDRHSFCFEGMSFLICGGVWGLWQATVLPGYFVQ
jgi:hypothetical protein